LNFAWLQNISMPMKTHAGLTRTLLAATFLAGTTGLIALPASEWQTLPQPPATAQPPVGGSAAAPGQGRGSGQGSPGAAVYAQFCASCHGPTLQGGSAASLVDGDWKFGGDDASIVASIRDGRPGTAMVPFKDLLNDEQIRQLVFHIRTQAELLKGKPEVKVDPEGHVVKSEKQTVKLEVVARDLETPWGIGFLPDKRMIVSERPGKLRIVQNGKVLPPVTGTPVPWVRQDGGYFDIEVDPQYAKNGWIYLAYS
jgi:mono/diheme cytochrome c family protein